MVRQRRMVGKWQYDNFVFVEHAVLSHGHHLRYSNKAHRLNNFILGTSSQNNEAILL